MTNSFNDIALATGGAGVASFCIAEINKALLDLPGPYSGVIFSLLMETANNPVKSTFDIPDQFRNVLAHADPSCATAQVWHSQSATVKLKQKEVSPRRKGDLLDGLSSRIRLGGLLYLVSEQLGDDLVNDLVGQGADLVPGFGLNGMLNENRLVVRHAKGGALGVGRTDEFGRGHIGGRNSLLFKIDDIVRTARNAAPSIAEGFNDGVTLLAEFGFQRLGSGPGNRRLHAA